MKDDQVTGRVNNDSVAGSGAAIKIAQTDYSGNTNSARKYRCVRGPTAGVGGERPRMIQDPTPQLPRAADPVKLQRRPRKGHDSATARR